MKSGFKSWQRAIIAVLMGFGALGFAGERDAYFKAEPPAPQDGLEVTINRIKLTQGGEVWVKLNVVNKSRQYVFINKDAFSVAIGTQVAHRKGRLPLNARETLKPGATRPGLDLRFPFSKTVMQRTGIDTVKELTVKLDGFSKAPTSGGSKSPLSMPALKATRLEATEAAAAAGQDTQEAQGTE